VEASHACESSVGAKCQVSDVVAIPQVEVDCNSPQNAPIASCRSFTLEKPKAAAAALRPPNCCASAETLLP
jgi:hypothetical protein